MYKYFFILWVLLILNYSSQAQQSNIEQLLQSIEANNQSLHAFRSLMKARVLQNKSENSLPDPEASMYYLPFGTHNSGDYSEFEFSQRVEFPTVYASRATWIDQKETRLELEYEKLKQETLLKANNLGLELIHIYKQRALLQKRLSQWEKIYTHVEILFEKGQTGILEFNKIKIVRLDHQFALEELKNRELNASRQLEALNGGKEFSIVLEEYPTNLEIPLMDSLWIDRTKHDAQIALLHQDNQLAEQNLRVVKNKLLPDLTIGYNYQGVSGENYSGLYGGISIPFWQGNNNVKMARANIEYYENHKEDVLTSLESEYATKIRSYQLLLEKFKEYKKAMDGINSENLLQKSYELGEISFMDYYREISFYRDAENRMLEIEKELQQLRAELFKHQL